MKQLLVLVFLSMPFAAAVELIESSESDIMEEFSKDGESETQLRGTEKRKHRIRKLERLRVIKTCDWVMSVKDISSGKKVV